MFASLATSSQQQSTKVEASCCVADADQFVL